MLKTIFFGTPQFASPFLEALINDPDIEVIAAVTQPDKPAGRGYELKPSPIKTIAQERGIPVFDYKSLKKPEVTKELKTLNADVFTVVAYGKLIPKAILDTPRLGCVNVHPSLLPKHRGPSPMQWALMEGDEVTGVSIMVLDEGMDTGPILAQSKINLDGSETYLDLQVKVHNTGTDLLVTTLKEYANGSRKPQPQDESQATLTRLLKKEDGHINWNAPAEATERRLRAFTPWPGLFTLWQKGSVIPAPEPESIVPSENNGSRIKSGMTRLKILQIEITDTSLPPGEAQIINNQLLIGTGTTALQILELQPEGKPAMKAEEFLKGHLSIHKSLLL